MTPLRRPLTALIALIVLATGCTTENSRACEIDTNCFNDEQCVAGFCQRRTEDPEDTDDPDVSDADTDQPDTDAAQPDTDADQPDADTCLPGFNLCDDACVDLQNNPDFCGDCNTTCTDAESCLDGTCTSELSVLTVDEEPDTGFFNALALDSDGNPHIVYYADASRELRYATFDGNEWQRSVVERDLPITLPTDIYLDDQNRPHIAYIRATGTPTPVYATREQEDWVLEAIHFAGDGPIDLTPGLGGRPTLTFYEVPFMTPTLYSRGDEGWTSENSPASDDTITVQALAGDAITPLAIAYKTATDSIELARRSMLNSQWEQTTLATNANTSSTMALTLTPASAPVLATLNTERTELLIFHSIDASWSNERHTVGLTDADAASPTLDLSAADNAFVAGLHISTTHHARVLKFTASPSDGLPLLHEPAHPDSNTSVAIDARGRTHTLFVSPEGHLSYVILP